MWRTSSDGRICFDQRGSDGSVARFWRTGTLVDTRAFAPMGSNECRAAKPRLRKSPEGRRCGRLKLAAHVLINRAIGGAVRLSQ
jgi:hypothetical protein